MGIFTLGKVLSYVSSDFLMRKIKGTYFSPNIYDGKYIYTSNIIFEYIDNHKGEYMGMFM